MSSCRRACITSRLLVPEASVILFCCLGVSGVSGWDCGSGVTGLAMRASSGAARISPRSKVLGSRSSTSNSCSGSGRSTVTYFSFSRIVHYVRCRLETQSSVKILTSSHCLGLDRQRSSLACLHGRSFLSFSSRAVFVQLTGTGKYFPLWFGEV